MSAYDVSTVRGSEKFSYQQAIDVYVTPKSPKGGSKTDFSVSRNKIQFQWNKVCYKVLFCENFQQQSCTAVNQL